MHFRRKWRKLHFGVDAGNRQVVAVSFNQDLRDECQVGPPLAPLQFPIEQITADGAYDGEPTYRTIPAHDAAIAFALASVAVQQVV